MTTADLRNTLRVKRFEFLIYYVSTYEKMCHVENFW